MRCKRPLSLGAFFLNSSNSERYSVEDNALRKSKVIYLNGEDVKIFRITPRTLLPTITFVSKVFSSLSVTDGVPSVNLLDPVVILNLISENLEGSLEILATLSSVGKDDLMDRDLDFVVAIAIAIIEENYRFFTEKVLPRLLEAERKIPALDKKG